MKLFHQWYLKKWQILSISSFILVFALVSFRDQILPIPGYLLMTTDQSDPADAIVILMGNTVPRTTRAAELYHLKMSKKILIAHPEATQLETLGLIPSQIELTRKLLIKLGVNPMDITVTGHQNNSSTFEEAKTILTYLHLFDSTNKIILVTDWYHSRRAQWTFNRFNSPIVIQVSPVTTPKSHPEHWWHYESSMIALFNEYVKWLFYLIHY